MYMQRFSWWILHSVQQPPIYVLLYLRMQGWKAKEHLTVTAFCTELNLIFGSSFTDLFYDPCKHKAHGTSYILTFETVI